MAQRVASVVGGGWLLFLPVDPDILSDLMSIRRNSVLMPPCTSEQQQVCLFSLSLQCHIEMDELAYTSGFWAVIKIRIIIQNRKHTSLCAQSCTFCINGMNNCGKTHFAHLLRYFNVSD